MPELDHAASQSAAAAASNATAAEAVSASKPAGSAARRLLSRREFGLACALLVILLPLSILNPRIVDLGNLTDVTINASLIGIIGLGQMLVMLTRNIDLSVASILGLTAYITASTLANHPDLPIVFTLLLACGVGLVCGLINGLTVAYGGVPSIVVTLGTLAVYRGFDSILSSGRQIASGSVPSNWLAMTAAKILGVSVLILAALILFVIVGVLLRWTAVGRQVYATGSNPGGAELIGIPAKRRIAMAFVVSGVLSGLTGALWASHYATVDGQTAYGLELTIVASVVVGGVALRGGVGTAIGVAIGTFGLLIIQNALALAKVDSQYLQAVYGVAILLAVSIDAIIGRRAVQRRKAVT